MYPYVALGAILGPLAVWIIINVVLIALWRAQRRRHAALLARCEYEHDAWRRGDDVLAFYGQYPPPLVRQDGKLIRVWSDYLPDPNRWNDPFVYDEPLDDAIRNFVY